MRERMRTWVAIAASGALLLTTAACGTPETESSEASPSPSGASELRTFEADNGAVEVPTDPQRVVALSYAVQPAIELGASVVGVDTQQNWGERIHPDDVATVDSVEQVGSTSEPNYEAIAGLEPDLIVVGWPKRGLDTLPVADLEAIAPTAVIGLGDPSSWKELESRVADVVGRTGAYEDVQQQYDQRVTELGEEYAETLDSTDFAFIRSTEGTPGAQAGQVMQEFGPAWNTNIAEEVGLNFIGEQNEASRQAWAAYYSLEELDKVADADAILTESDPEGNVPDATQQILDMDAFSSLPAAQDDQVHPFPWSGATTHKSALLTLDSLDTILEQVSS
ncbi:ABC transporter substrate-binding protein [Salinactinospora qingdaonensis]|uniref:Fe/B12 periplasmic-binding domain-containing protein n=1 Tax=Salinactinospora qingdaonensis TaxID=702744 RepID=A0ABP7F077_9ACTN